MNKRPPLIDKDGEVRELTAEDMRLFKPADGWQTRMDVAFKDGRLRTHSPG